jgi:hypothetical protein
LGYFFQGKSYVLIFYKKMGWTTFCAMFSQAHPVTLRRCGSAEE